MLRKWTLAYRIVGKLPVPQWHETPCMHAYAFFFPIQQFILTCSLKSWKIERTQYTVHWVLYWG